MNNGLPYKRVKDMKIYDSYLNMLFVHAHTFSSYVLMNSLSFSSNVWKFFHRLIHTAAALFLNEFFFFVVDDILLYFFSYFFAVELCLSHCQQQE